MVVTDRDYDVTGTLNPDATGFYDVAGMHNGEPYLRRQDGAYFNWWDGIVIRNITPTLGGAVPPTWSKIGTAIVGDYNPTLPYTGIATVSVAP